MQKVLGSPHQLSHIFYIWQEKDFLLNFLRDGSLGKSLFSKLKCVRANCHQHKSYLNYYICSHAESYDHWYYYNSVSGITQWEHPVDTIYRQKLQQARENFKLQLEIGSKYLSCIWRFFVVKVLIIQLFIYMINCKI